MHLCYNPPAHSEQTTLVDSRYTVLLLELNMPHLHTALHLCVIIKEVREM